ncbi:hypothetical protein SAMN05444337_0820 [Flavobacterium haoranii]|uniref:Uncharacterized protein n=2 Tax=Flavobacterium haoranii TaxID=683124 RepID=A0A1M6E2H2_9FLAO|nr:hypothetical protein SAMN05444337_0820 [Flavobacterium haoranii]
MIYGKYVWDGGYDVYESIQIKSDSTFEFNWHAGLAGEGITLGKWKVNNGNLVLNSFNQSSNTLNFVVLNELVNSKDFIEVKIVDQYGPVFGANCELLFKGNNVAFSTSNSDGIVMISKQKFDTIKITFIGKQEIIYLLKYKDFNFFEFEMLDKVDYLFFNNEKWKIKKNRLYSKRVKSIKSLEKNYYEKVE